MLIHKIPCFLFVLLLSYPLFPQSKTKHVLIINSYHRGYFWSDRIMEGVDSVFDSMKNTEVYYEYLDTKRKNSKEYLASLKNVFLIKYKNHNFDLVLVSDDNGFDFTLDLQKTIFSKTPIVFCGLNDFNPSILKGRTNITGITEYYDPLETLRAVDHIFPKKNLYISLYDNTKSGLINYELFLRAMNKMPGNIKHQSWHDLTIDELTEKIQRVPENAVLIYTDYNRDSDGTVLSKGEIVEILSKSNSPVFGRLEWLLGHGLFGGMVVSGFYHGKTAALMAEQVLDGRDINSIPVITETPNRYMFDYNLMEKFHVKTEDLPRNSIVINKPSKFYDFYRKNREFVLSITLVFLLIIILILGISYYKITRLNRERIKLINSLSESLARIKRLDGLLPICANCKKIRNDQGYWEQIEVYIRDHSEADFSHSLCEECFKKLYPDLKYPGDVEDEQKE